jgi:hypothetical protein
LPAPFAATAQPAVATPAVWERRGGTAAT